MRLEEAGERRIIEEMRRAIRRDPGMIADFDDDLGFVDGDFGDTAFDFDHHIWFAHGNSSDPFRVL